MSYLQDNSAFLGTGERDRKGKTLQEFLDAYDPKKYDSWGCVRILRPQPPARWKTPAPAPSSRKSLRKQTAGFFLIPFAVRAFSGLRFPENMLD